MPRAKPIGGHGRARRDGDAEQSEAPGRFGGGVESHVGAGRGAGQRASLLWFTDSVTEPERPRYSSSPMK